MSTPGQHFLNWHLGLGRSNVVVVTIEPGCVVRFRIRPFLMVITALAIVVVMSAVVLGASKPSHPGSTGLLTPVTSLVVPSVTVTSSNLETIGGCAEDAHDHNHDVDPRGFIDQEDDECLPAQHAPRLPDGAPAN